jgi:hypothetical protein
MLTTARNTAFSTCSKFRKSKHENSTGRCSSNVRPRAGCVRANTDVRPSSPTGRRDRPCSRPCRTTRGAGHDSRKGRNRCNGDDGFNRNDWTDRNSRVTWHDGFNGNDGRRRRQGRTRQDRRHYGRGCSSARPAALTDRRRGAENVGCLVSARTAHGVISALDTSMRLRPHFHFARTVLADCVCACRDPPRLNESPSQMGAASCPRETRLPLAMRGLGPGTFALASRVRHGAGRLVCASEHMVHLSCATSTAVPGQDLKGE